MPEPLSSSPLPSLVVAKFGGSSLADAASIKKVIGIIRADPNRRCIVVSAPGKRNPHDHKVTDLFYMWHRLHAEKLSTEEVHSIVWERYHCIINDLGLSIKMSDELGLIDEAIRGGATADYAASRGEYLNAKIVAAALGYDFLDAASCIFFDEAGQCINTDEHLRTLVGDRCVVIPGFYGSMPDGSIKTFSRGGSDLSGAIVARAMRAQVYENWTDVPGLLMTDPRVVPNPRSVRQLTYFEMRELSYMGASVFHEEAMFPVRSAGITTNIRSVHEPDSPGTLIVPENESSAARGTIIGIAGRTGFTVVNIAKALMNQEIGFARRVLTVLESLDISFEHMPGGIDTLSLIVDDRQLAGKLQRMVADIRTECSPDTLEVSSDIALIATVGSGIVHTQGVAARLFQALAHADVNIRMINQGSSELSIMVGVESKDYETAVRAIYEAFTIEAPLT